MKYTLLFLLLLGFSVSADERVEWEVFPKEYQAPAGQVIRGELEIRVAEGLHLYANPMGPGPGVPLEIQFSSPVENFRVNYPEGIRYEVPELETHNFVYPSGTRIPFEIKVPGVSPSVLHTTLIATGLSCGTVCVPARAEIPLTIQVTTETAGEAVFGSFDISREAKEDWGYLASFLFSILLGLLGGLALNVMPCVLPVLSLKLYALVNRREGESHVVKALGYATGTTAVFLLLAAGASFLGWFWGQQFQNEVFVSILFCVVLVFGLALFDVFTLSVPSIGGGGAKKEGGFWESFFQGILATFLATPCGAPFLIGTLGWTLTQTPFEIFVIYFFIGIGMALPFLAAAFYPPILRHLPKPGEWMVTFRKVSGFLILATAVYLLSLLPEDSIVPVAGFGLSLAFFFWLVGRNPVVPLKQRPKDPLVGLAIVLLTGWLLLLPGENMASAWKDWSPGVVEIPPEKPAIIDFTANWCPNCKVNEARVLHVPEVVMELQRKGIRLYKVDLTRDDAAKSELLKKLGGNSIPYLVYFPGGGKEPKVLDGLISGKEQLLNMTNDTN